MPRTRNRRRGRRNPLGLKVILERVPDPDLEALDRAYAMIFRQRPDSKIAKRAGSEGGKQQRLL